MWGTGGRVRKGAGHAWPGMFDTDLNREFLIAHTVFGLDAPALAGLARRAVHASFADPPTRSRILAEIDAYLGR